MSSSGNQPVHGRLRRRSRRPRDRAWIRLLVVAVTAAGIGLLARHGGVLRRQELSSIDARFQIRGKQATPPDLVVVGVDDQTLAALKSDWPLPRFDEATVIQRLAEDGAKVIAVDVQFTEPTSRTADDALISAVRNAGNVVLATSETDDHGHTNVFGGDAVVAGANAVVGDTLFPNDVDGVMRRMQFEFGGLTAFSIVTVDRAEDRTIGRSALGGKTALIDYRGGAGTFQTVSFSDVMLGRVPASVFHGKFVVVGVTAPDLGDVDRTPTSGAMSGPEIEANAIWTVLHGFPLRRAGEWLAALLIVLAAFVPPLAAWRVGVLRSLLSTVVFALGYLVAVQLAFDHGLVLPVVYPLLVLVLASIGVLIALAPRRRPTR